VAALAVAAHFGVAHPAGTFAWLGDPTVMWVLVGAGAAELLADKVPLLDHALHVVQVVTKPAAAAILVGGTLHAQTRDQLILLMVVGALNALGVHGAVASVRAASTLTTAGTANPLLSVGEDVGTAGTVGLGFAAPFAAALLAIVLTLLLMFVAIRIARYARRQSPAVPRLPKR
jgi:hypothetical protein